MSGGFVSNLVGLNSVFDFIFQTYQVINEFVTMDRSTGANLQRTSLQNFFNFIILVIPSPLICPCPLRNLLPNFGH